MSTYIALTSIAVSLLTILFWPLFWFFRVRRW